MRRSARISKEIPILLIGSDLDGRMFSEPTSTVLLSLHGAGILSRHKLSPEQELVLRWPEKNKEAEIRVVGHIGEQSGRHAYGVAFFGQNLNFWEIDFPPISEMEKQLGLLSLVCGSCKTLEKVDDAGFEADICAAGEGVLRYCKHCGSSTLWKPSRPVAHQPSASVKDARLPLFSASPTPPPAPTPAPSSSCDSAPHSSLLAPPFPSAPQSSFYAQSRGVSPDSPSASSNFHASRPAFVADPVGEPSSDPAGARSGPVEKPPAAVLTLSPPAPEKPAAPVALPINRRKHPRVKVSCSACVRIPERGDDVVQCEDMSKGGLRFKSRQKYYPQSLIEVAVPYQPGQPAIFVPARIVFVEPLPEQSLFRCGIEYFKPTKPRGHF